MLNQIIVTETEFDVSVFPPVWTVSCVFGSNNCCDEVNTVCSLNTAKCEVCLSVILQTERTCETKYLFGVNSVVRYTVDYSVCCLRSFNLFGDFLNVCCYVQTFNCHFKVKSCKTYSYNVCCVNVSSCCLAYEYVIYPQYDLVTKFSNCYLDVSSVCVFAVDLASTRLIVPLPIACSSESACQCDVGTVNNVATLSACACCKTYCVNVTENGYVIVSENCTKLGESVVVVNLTDCCIELSVDVTTACVLHPYNLFAVACVVSLCTIFDECPAVGISEVCAVTQFCAFSMGISQCFHDELSPQWVTVFSVEVQTVVEHVDSCTARFGCKCFVGFDICKPVVVLGKRLDFGIYFVVGCYLVSKHCVGNECYPIQLSVAECLMVSIEQFKQSCCCLFLGQTFVIDVVYTNVHYNVRRIVSSRHVLQLVHPIDCLCSADTFICVTGKLCNVTCKSAVLPEFHVGITHEQCVNVFFFNCFQFVFPTVSNGICGSKVISYFQSVSEGFKTEVHVLIVFAVVNRTNLYTVCVKVNVAVLVNHCQSDCLCFKVEHAVFYSAPCSPSAYCLVCTYCCTTNTVDISGLTSKCVNVEEQTVHALSVKQHHTELAPCFVGICK